MNQLMNKENTLLLLVFSLLNVTVFYVLGPAAEVITFTAGTDWSMVKLLTTHFSHHSEMHLWNNVLAMALLLALFPGRNDSLLMAYLFCVVITACYVSYYEINYFLGFSALLYCIPGCYFTASLIMKKFDQACIILLVLWLYLNFISPIKYDDLEAWRPFTAAHVIGFLAGTMAQLLLSIVKMETIQNGKNHPLH